MIKIFFLTIFLGLAGWGIFGIYKQVNNCRWDGLSRFVYLDTSRADFAEIRSIDPKEKNNQIKINLPMNVVIETLENRGVWTLAAVIKLGNKYGSDWVLGSISHQLGVVITGTSESMCWWDRVRWWHLSRKANWKIIDSFNNGALISSKTPDGQLEYRVNSKWQGLVKKYLTSWVMQEQLISVSVYNTTSITGMGNKYAQIFENTGLKVHMIGDRSAIPDKCRVITSNQAKTRMTAKWINKNLGCIQKINPDLNEDEIEVEIGLL